MESTPEAPRGSRPVAIGGRPSPRPRLLDTHPAPSSFLPMPTWVGPLAAISLAVIATSLLVMGGVVLAIGLGLRRARKQIGARLAGFTADARAATSRLRTEVEGYADLSGEARTKLQAAVRKVEERLTDLDALVEVLQEEAEETALDVAAFVRTARRPAALFGAARSAFRVRRRRR